jgi:hypothetical protein
MQINAVLGSAASTGSDPLPRTQIRDSRRTGMAGPLRPER